MITINKNKNLTAKYLTIPELNKDKERWDTFLLKLKNNSPFTCNDGNKVLISNNDEIISSITDENGKLNINKVNSYLKPNNRYSAIFETEKGSIKLNDLHKTHEFGGGSGISLGTSNAKKYETIQSLFFSLRQYIGRDVITSDVKTLLNSIVEDSVVSTIDITNTDLNYFNSNGWLFTYVKTANVFFKSLDPSKKYKFYHSSCKLGIPYTINKTFLRLFRDVDKKNKIKINMSRWNPSDIWAIDIDNEETIINLMNNCKTIMEFNTIIDTSFDKNLLVGISLKKIKRDTNIQLIVSKTLHTKFIYDYSLTSNGPLDTLTVKILAKSYSWLGNKKDEMLDARIYTGEELGNIFLEVRSSSSKYGKSSLNYINFILNKCNIEPIPKYNEITLSNEELGDEIIKYHNNTQNLQKTLFKKSSDYNSKWDIGNTRSKLISKYQALMLVDILEHNKRKPHKKSLFGLVKFLFNKKLSVTNYIIKEIFYYAYSMGSDLFDNTKFYRIKTL